MKNFKRLFVLVLAVAMCLTAFAISSSAAGDFNPTIGLLARYNETGDKIIVTVTTDDKYGALMGTLTFPEGAALNIQLADSKFVEAVDADNKEFYSKTDNSVTFAVVTDNVTEGSKTWVDVYFSLDVDKLDENTNFTFKFQDVQVCDVNEQFVEGKSAPDAIIEIPFVSLRALGAKKQSDADAILFGSRVDLTGSSSDAKFATEIVVNGETYKAKACGYAYAYTSNVSANDFAGFGVQFNGEGNVVALDATTTLVKDCKYYKYWNTKDGYFVYTLKVNNIKPANLGKEIAVKPYVVYADANGNKYLMQGNVISRSCNGIAEAPAFLGNESETDLW